MKNGNFDRDYFALINKPAINGLLLDQHSAVVTRDRQGNKHVYFSGLHLPSPGEQVVHSLDLCQRYFHWGSDPTQNPFKTPKHNPSSYESIGRNSSAVSITGTGLINEIILAPAFSIHYTLISAEQEANWIRKVRVLSSLFESQKIYGNLSPQIDELIGTHITGQIKNIIQNIKFPSAPIKDAFPANILQSIETLLDKHLSDEQLEKSLETQILRQMTVKVHVEKVWVK